MPSSPLKDYLSTVHPLKEPHGCGMLNFYNCKLTRQKRPWQILVQSSLVKRTFVTKPVHVFMLADLHSFHLHPVCFSMPSIVPHRLALEGETDQSSDDLTKKCETCRVLVDPWRWKAVWKPMRSFWLKIWVPIDGRPLCHVDSGVLVRSDA